jgi:two-component system, NtrC family, sensor kinase
MQTINSIMKKIISLLFSLFLFSMLHAQYKVKFIVKEKTAIHHDSIFITGTFSNWDSTVNKNFLMLPLAANEKSIVLNLKAGVIRYKFHRGSWYNVEKQFYGGEVPDRVITIRKDTVLIDSVACWRDQVVIDKKMLLQQQKEDTTRIGALAAIASSYAFYPEFYNADSALYYAQKALQVHQKIVSSEEYKVWTQSGYSVQLLWLQEVLAGLMHSLGNYPKSLEIRLENLKLAEISKDKIVMVQTIRNVTTDYASMKDYQNVLKYSKIMDSILSTLNLNDPAFLPETWSANHIIAGAWYNLNEFDSALYYATKMKTIITNVNQPYYTAFGSRLLADIYAAKADNDTAFFYYRQGIEKGSFIGAPQVVGGSCAGISKLFQKEGRLDSALHYARLALNNFQNNKIDIQAWGENTDSYIADISPLLAELYKVSNQPDSAYKYLQLSVTLKDSLYNTNKMRQFQTLTFNEAARRQQLEEQSIQAKRQYETKVKIYGLITGMAGVLVLAFVLYKNNKQKQKANTILQSQKQEIETTLGELQHTQKQLIQSEKMASLGELTAGIAHEIQNPLNFVNNFSEINTELIEEMKTELKAGKNEAAISIANDIAENEQKINHHGKRADAIVKGMLQHSRTSTGQKEPTNINALADEYLRLAYHGLRAKDKTFNATMKTDFDESVGNIYIIPQDIGRVLLNLITNAFYATSEKKNVTNSAEHPYEPTVAVSTKRIKDTVEIKVGDNGNGIPQKVLDKIFQPFFTTKPTGQGTGLGLSLAYDIIKAHGGDIKVDTAEGKGSAFIINLPVNS